MSSLSDEAASFMCWERRRQLIRLYICMHMSLHDAGSAGTCNECANLITTTMIRTTFTGTRTTMTVMVMMLLLLVNDEEEMTTPR